MRGLWFCAALAASCPAWAQTAPAPTQTATPLADPHVITNPDWLHKPGPEEFSEYFPKGTTSTGDVVIQCDVTAQGSLAGCVIVAEEPPNQGFGQAALKISRFFKMKPQTRDGVPVGGALFETRIHFVYAGVVPPRWVHAPTPDDMLAVWPPGAPETGGRVTLSCVVTQKGQAKDCHVAREDPAGMGFGAAALKLVSKFQLTPVENYGTPIEAQAQLTLGFAKPPPKQSGTEQYGGLAALSNAPWQTTPTAAEMAAAWPKTAPADLAFAKVRLRCGFLPDSTLSRCEVLSEDPAKLGFGAAALALVPRFTTRGALMDESLLDKAHIILAFTFTNPAMGGQAPDWLTRPNWVTFIEADRMTQLYPPAAADAGIKTGRGVVICTVAQGGTLTGCTVESEDPAGKGFGASALAAIMAFTVNPWTDDGRPVDGAKIRVPIRFVESEPPPQPAPAPGQDGAPAAPPHVGAQ